MIDEGRLEEVMELMESMEIATLSTANQFRMAALFALMGAKLRGQTPAAEEQAVNLEIDSNRMLTRSRSILLGLAEENYFSENLEAEEHVRTSDDFQLYREWDRASDWNRPQE